MLAILAGAGGFVYWKWFKPRDPVGVVRGYVAASLKEDEQAAREFLTKESVYKLDRRGEKASQGMSTIFGSDLSQVKEGKQYTLALARNNGGSARVNFKVDFEQTQVYKAAKATGAPGAEAGMQILKDTPMVKDGFPFILSNVDGPWKIDLAQTEQEMRLVVMESLQQAVGKMRSNPGGLGGPQPAFHP